MENINPHLHLPQVVKDIALKVEEKIGDILPGFEKCEDCSPCVSCHDNVNFQYRSLDERHMVCNKGLDKVDKKKKDKSEEGNTSSEEAEKSEKKEKPEKGDKAEKSDKSEKKEKPEKGDVKKKKDKGD